MRDLRRPGQSNFRVLDWPWRSFFLHVVTLVVTGLALGAGVSAWMARAGRLVETAVTTRFDLAVGFGIAVVLSSVVVVLRYWKRAPFLWACVVGGSFLCGGPAFGVGFLMVAAVFMLIFSKVRDLTLYWFRS